MITFGRIDEGADIPRPERKRGRCSRLSASKYMQEERMLREWEIDTLFDIVEDYTGKTREQIQDSKSYSQRGGKYSGMCMVVEAREMMFATLMALGYTLREEREIVGIDLDAQNRRKALRKYESRHVFRATVGGILRQMAEKTGRERVNDYLREELAVDPWGGRPQEEQAPQEDEEPKAVRPRSKAVQAPKPPARVVLTPKQEKDREKWEKFKADPERYEAYKARARAYQREYHENLKADPERYEADKARKRAYQRERRAKLKSDPEQYEAYKARERAHQREYHENLKSDPERYEARKARMRAYQRERRAKLKAEREARRS